MSEQTTEPAAIEEPEPTPLPYPADGVPEVSVTRRQLGAAADLLAGGHGPFAVDAERASGFRYSNRAYLIQIRRAGAGTVLIDPVGAGEDPAALLRPVAEVLDDDEWILHAADQDLACLAEVGMWPKALYDTELAGRLAGFERVNLAAMVQRLLGLGLAKATVLPTGRSDRCPRIGSTMRHSMSRCSSSCATRSPRSSTSRAKPIGRHRNSITSG